jgi:hypothetical protein
MQVSRRCGAHCRTTGQPCHPRPLGLPLADLNRSEVEPKHDAEVELQDLPAHGLAESLMDASDLAVVHRFRPVTDIATRRAGPTKREPAGSDYDVNDFKSPWE